MFDEASIQPIDFARVRKPPTRLIYLGNVSRPYGIAETDTWNMNSHLAAVMSNGLRMLIAYGVGVRDEKEYERIAQKLEFYATDTSVLHSYIDWSQDPDRDIGDDNWLDTSDQPGFKEYCEKSEQIEYWQRHYMSEALDWLKVHWGELWD
jgi:hypothetical protein